MSKLVKDNANGLTFEEVQCQKLLKINYNLFLINEEIFDLSILIYPSVRPLTRSKLFCRSWAIADIFVSFSSINSNFLKSKMAFFRARINVNWPTVSPSFINQFRISVIIYEYKINSGYQELSKLRFNWWGLPTKHLIRKFQVILKVILYNLRISTSCISRLVSSLFRHLQVRSMILVQSL